MERSPIADRPDLVARHLLLGRRREVLRLVQPRPSRPFAGPAAPPDDRQAPPVLDELTAAERAELGAIDAALHRLDEGRWGRCTACGGPIDAARLAILPEAATCDTCEESY